MHKPREKFREKFGETQRKLLELIGKNPTKLDINKKSNYLNLPHKINCNVAQRARSSKDRTPVSLTGISHEFEFNPESHQTHTLTHNRDNNYINFSPSDTSDSDIPFVKITPIKYTVEKIILTTELGDLTINNNLTPQDWKKVSKLKTGDYIALPKDLNNTREIEKEKCKARTTVCSGEGRTFSNWVRFPTRAHAYYKKGNNNYLNLSITYISKLFKIFHNFNRHTTLHLIRNHNSFFFSNKFFIFHFIYFFKSFKISQEFHSPTSLNLIRQFNQFIPCHSFWIFHINSPLNKTLKIFRRGKT